MRLSQVIEELVEEKGLDRATLSAIMCEGMLAAYTKKYPLVDLIVEYNKKADEIEVYSHKKITSLVKDEETEISLRRARIINPAAELEQIIKTPFLLPIGRIEILKAKNIIAQKIRAIEAEIIYKRFHSQEGTLVHGTVHKCEHNGITIKIEDSLAFLPKSLSIPTDKFTIGYTVKALLKEVLLEPRNENQLILDRVNPDFLKKLFEAEIPEVFEKLVEIKKIVRIAGYKSKVLVVSHDKNIDPIGTCVGIGGARIKPILKELGMEKVDILSMQGTMEDLIRDALRPAEINRIELLEDKSANIWVNDDQRSIAIGKMGQNIALASDLTGISIHIVKSDEENSR